MESLRTYYRTLFDQEPAPESTQEQISAQIEKLVATLKTINEARTAINSQTSDEEASLKRAKAIADRFEHLKVIDDKSTPPGVDDCYAYLKVRCEGKLVDATYNAYCASIIRQYFTTRKQVSNKQEYAIMNAVMNIHLVNIRPQYDYDIHNLVRYNDCVNYVKRRTIRIFNQIVEIPLTSITLEDLNICRPVATLAQSSCLWKLVKMLLLIIAIYIGACYTILPFLNLMISIITLNPQQQQSLPIKTDTSQSYYASMIQPCLTTIKYSADLSADYSLGVMKSISSLWTVPQNDDFISRLSSVFEVDKRSRVASLLSQSWKKWEQISTSLLDSYKHATQPLTWLTEDISNHLNAASSFTAVLAKELMTKSAQKYIS